jgi:hypothetical protein
VPPPRAAPPRAAPPFSVALLLAGLVRPQTHRCTSALDCHASPTPGALAAGM